MGSWLVRLIFIYKRISDKGVNYTLLGVANMEKSGDQTPCKGRNQFWNFHSFESQLNPRLSGYVN